MSDAVGKQFSPPCSITFLTTVEKSLPLALQLTCLVVRSGRSSLNFFHAERHVAVIAASQPQPEEIISPRKKNLGTTSYSLSSTSTLAKVELRPNGLIQLLSGRKDLA